MKKNEKIKLPEGVIKIKKGYNPNSSSIGTLIYSFPLALFAISSILSILAALTGKKRDKKDDKKDA